MPSLLTHKLANVYLYKYICTHTRNCCLTVSSSFVYSCFMGRLTELERTLYISAFTAAKPLWLSVSRPLCVPQCPPLPSFFYQLPASQCLPFTLHVSRRQWGRFKYILFLFAITFLPPRRVTVVTVQTSSGSPRYRPSKEKGQCCRSLYSRKDLFPPKLFSLWDSMTSIHGSCFLIVQTD